MALTSRQGAVTEKELGVMPAARQQSDWDWWDCEQCVRGNTRSSEFPLQIFRAMGSPFLA